VSGALEFLGEEVPSGGVEIGGNKGDKWHLTFRDESYII